MNDIEYKAKRAEMAIKAISSDYRERIEAAESLYTGIGLLADLAKDSEWEVRRAVASNLSTTAGILEALSKDKEPDVRFEVALNIDVPEEVLKALILDPVDWISNTAKQNLEHLDLLGR